MKKIFNQKGFAITSFLYSVFLLAVVFFVLILLLVINSSTTFYKFQKSVKKDLDEISYIGNVNSYATITFPEQTSVIMKGENFDFLKGVKLIRYDRVELDNEITYTSSPTFDNNQLGKYVITYKATVNGKIIQNTRVVSVVPALYANGQRVYFDVVKGTGCTMEEYASSYYYYGSTRGDYQNSFTGYNGVDKTGNQNSCLLFYAFNYDGGETVNLILDHNTTGTDYWTESGNASNVNGPITVLKDLKNATSSWNGTITPENYSVAQTGYGNYTIAYKTGGYKARLITAQEIAKITGADIQKSFNESTSNATTSYFYFDSLSSSASSTCTSGNTSGCQYGWLYDRTRTDCEIYGCYNNADAGMIGYGYWTGTSVVGISGRAWHVRNYGGALYDFYVSNNYGYGARPVITVLKSKISPGEEPIQPPLPEYANGQRVYFDVVKGTGCTMEEYASSYYYYDSTNGDYQNSFTGYNGVDKTGIQNSCLLFYAFNYDGGETVNLILDHNTTGTDYWTESGNYSNANGPITVLNDLKTATSSWNGTITPANYSVAQTGYGNYTISYQTEGYKARLITAQEIAKITGGDTREGLLFDESTSDYNSWFIFDEYHASLYKQVDEGTLTYDEYEEQALAYYAANTVANGWLYDRTHTSCKDYGCYNNADAGMTGWGYWTGTSALGDSRSAWFVSGLGDLSDYYVNYGSRSGARPVITVLKSKLSPGIAPTHS